MLSDLIRKDVCSEAEPNLVLCLVKLVDSLIGTPATKKTPSLNSKIHLESLFFVQL